MIQNTNNFHQLLITRNGSIDWEYTNTQLALERRQKLQEAARSALEATMAQTLHIAKVAGSTALNVLNELVDAAQ